MKCAVQALLFIIVFTASAWAQFDTAYVPIRMINTAAKVKILPVGDASGFLGDSADVSVRNNTSRRLDTLKLLAPSGGFTSISHETQRLANVPANVVSRNRGSITLDLNPQTFSNARVSLFSMSGKRVMRGRVSASNTGGNISRRNIAQGVYLLQISGARDTFSNKFVHDGGKLDIKVTFGNESSLMKQAEAQAFDVVWKLTASANGYADTSYEITIQRGRNNPLQSITLRAAQITISGKSALQYFKDEKIKMGWNLGNTLDAVRDDDYGLPRNEWVAEETAWGNPEVTKALIDGVAAHGFDIVRIPCTWIGHIGRAPEYKLSEARLERVKEVVDWVLGTGMKAMIDMHHDGTNYGDGVTSGFLKFAEVVKGTANNETVKDQFAKVWAQIAEYFKDYDERLIFETMNEVHSGDWGRGQKESEQRLLCEWNQAALDAIRRTGGNNTTRYIAIQSLGSTEPPYVISAHSRGFLLPKDTANGVDRGTTKLIVAAHFYEPWSYTVGASTNTVTSSDLTYVKTVAENLYTNFIKEGIAVCYSEWGAQTKPRLNGSNNVKNTLINYVNSVASAATANGIVPFIWDDGNDYKILERNGNNVGNVVPGSLEADVLKAYQEAVSTTTVKQ